MSAIRSLVKIVPTLLESMVFGEEEIIRLEADAEDANDRLTSTTTMHPSL